MRHLEIEERDKQLSDHDSGTTLRNQLGRYRSVPTFNRNCAENDCNRAEKQAMPQLVPVNPQLAESLTKNPHWSRILDPLWDY